MHNTQTNQPETTLNFDGTILPSKAIIENTVLKVDISSNEGMKPSPEAISIVKPERLYKQVLEKNKFTGEVKENFQIVELPPKKYDWNVKLEEITIQEQELITRTVEEYSSLFKKAEEKSAREILEMCRVVYEANTTLDSAKFHDFCKRIGYRDSSSAIRKHIVIGKLQPRLINYAEALPATWTGIYTVTQIPAQVFENLMSDNLSLKEMPVSKIKGYIKHAELQNNINKYVPPKVYTQDEKDRIVVARIPLATINFTKLPDDLDWAAVRKALLEIEANLPIEITFTNGMNEHFNQRKVIRYTKMKREQNVQVFKPETWDLGRDVERMSKTAGGKIALEKNIHTHA